ncbi:MAG TPA: aldolase/citrate lyase family protein [Luteimonas sp.]|nr:aldolase/citrate lyase family protein [Luteimonas sp.]
MRSKLFVPGNRPALFAKALAGEADALSFDLEDAVADDAKADARTQVATLLASEAARGSGKTLIVRTNAVDSAWFADDVAALVDAGARLLNLPKIEHVDALHSAIAVIAAAERAADVAARVALLVNIETPEALANAAAIAAGDARVVGLQLGLADLFEAAGIDRRDPANVHAALFAVRMAAARAGVYAMDGAFAAIDDADGFAAEAAMSRRLGFIGKSCIHPRQVPLANAAFAPDEAELAAARRIVAAADDAGSLDAFLVDGRMVDRPFLQRARALLGLGVETP